MIKSSDLTLPKRKLFSRVPRQTGLCPVSPYGPFLNETENTALCRKLSLEVHFPFCSSSSSGGGNGDDDDNNNGNNKTIPIFWSGSSSFETFLMAEESQFNTRLVGRDSVSSNDRSRKLTQTLVSNP